MVVSRSRPRSGQRIGRKERFDELTGFFVVYFCLRNFIGNVDVFVFFIVLLGEYEREDVKMG